MALLRCGNRLAGEDRLKRENLPNKKAENLGKNVSFIPFKPLRPAKSPQNGPLSPLRLPQSTSVPAATLPDRQPQAWIPPARNRPGFPLAATISGTPLAVTGPSQRLQFSVPPRTWHPPQLSNERKNGKNECTARWCNGNTTDFGSVILGSNPSRVTSHLFGPPLPPDSHANFLREVTREVTCEGIFCLGNLSLGKGLDFRGFGLPGCHPPLAAVKVTFATFCPLPRTNSPFPKRQAHASPPRCRPRTQP